LKTNCFFKKRFLLVLLVLPFLASRCKKEEPPQSELVTANGLTLGCRLDGIPFISNSVPPIHIDLWYSPVGRYHYLIANGNKQNEYVEIYLNPPLTIGRRELKFATRAYPIYANPKDYGLYQKLSPNKEYITNDMLGGYVDIISVDTVTLKIEGRFEFVGTERITGEKITITNGYFKKA
jgi:hypothetical protein